MTSTPPERHGAVCAVMVTHNAGAKLRPVLASFLDQVDHLVIVDNASEPKARLMLQGVAAEDKRVTVILNAENAWLARALNQGVDLAEQRGYRFALLMNDGNLLSPNAVRRMVRRFDDPALGRVGSVNPRVVIGDAPIESGDKPAIDESMSVTAGCLVSIDAVRDVGPQREDFLIDMIDYDFALRLNRHGYRTLTEPSVSIACELGRTTRRRFLWRHCNVENYSPLRRYYFARNGLILVRETRHRELRRFWFRFLVTSCAKVVLYEDMKLRKLRMSMLGVWHGARGRTGDLSPLGTKAVAP